MNKKDDVKEILKEQSNEQEMENYKEGEINWIDDEYYDNWKDKIKPHTQTKSALVEFTEITKLP